MLQIKKIPFDEMSKKIQGKAFYIAVELFSCARD